MNGEPGPFGPWMDVSRTIAPGIPVWPGDPEVEEREVTRIDQGAVSNVTLFSLSSHTGTHVDPPYHFEPDGIRADMLDLDVLCGSCLVLDFSGVVEHVTAADLEAEPLAGETRLLLRTRNSGRPYNQFDEDFAALTPDAADAIVRLGIRLIGVDGPSVEPFGGTDFDVHHTLLRAGLILVEGLDLSSVEPGPYEMVCAPLKWKDADGAPARVLLRRAPNYQ